MRSRPYLRGWLHRQVRRARRAGLHRMDTGKKTAAPGATVNITALAATAKEDAEHFPGMYW